MQAPRPSAWREFWPAIVCGLVYLLAAGGFRGHYEQTPFAHHIYIADAFLHGQLYLRPEALDRLQAIAVDRARATLAQEAKKTGKAPTPEEQQAAIQYSLNYVTLLDWSVVDNKLYGYWGPLTPAVFVPIVAVFDMGISDNLFTALFGALNVALFCRLLRQVNDTALLPISPACRTALALGLGLGTVHFYMCCTGTVWVTAQVLALTAVLASCLALTSLRNRPRDVLLGAVFFGAALLGRNIVGAMLPFFIVLIFIRTAGLSARARELLRRYARFALPCMLAVGLQAAYNYGRFGSVFQTGQAELIRRTGNPRFVEEFDQYGQFNAHFLAGNAKHYLWNWSLPPKKEAATSSSGPSASGTFLVTPLLHGLRGVPLDCDAFDPDGNSMFLVTPLLLCALLAWRRPTGFTLALACGALPFLAALLLFRATGWVQFGNRYLLESLPLWLLLAGTGLRGRLTAAGYVLLVLSIAINLFGTYGMCQPMFDLLRPLLGPYVLPGVTLLALLAGSIVALRSRQPTKASGVTA